MPDAEGALTPDEFNVTIEYLNRIGLGSRSCPIHGGSPPMWEVQKYIVHAPVYTPIYAPRQFRLGGIAYPQIMIMCATCGYTIFINAVKSGLFSSAALPPGQQGATNG
jgi:hypothetical protein